MTESRIRTRRSIRLKRLGIGLIASLLLHPVSAADSPIEPQKVVIPTYYQETILLPKLPEHQYELHSPRHVAEPYRPDFVHEFVPLAEDYPQNIQPGWLARLSAGLAGFFGGSQGKLESAILQYEQQQYAAAERTFQSLIRAPERIRDPARLGMAWIRYQHRDFDTALKLLPPLHHSPVGGIDTEARYLTALIHIRQNRFNAILPLTEPLGAQTIADQDIRLISARLYAFLQLSQWAEIDRLLAARQMDADRYTRHYRFILETAGITAFYQHHYRQGLAFFEQAGALHPLPRYQADIGRKIGWTQYFDGQYAEALNTIDSLPPSIDERYTEELQYLRAICLLQLQRWDEVAEELKQIRKDALFHSLISYQIQIAVEDPERQREMIGQIDQQPRSNPEMRFYGPLFSANQAFRAGQYSEARDRLLAAVAVDIDNDDYQIAQYHLALTYLKLGEYTQAVEDLRRLDQPNTNADIRQRLRYHLAFALYQSDQPDACLQSLPTIEPAMAPALRNELMAIKAGALLKTGQHSAATLVLIDLWRTQKHQPALEDAVRILFHDGRFQEGLTLLQENPDADSPLLFRYRIRLLLGLGKAREAENLIGAIQHHDDRLIALQISVWEATQEWEKIVRRLNAVLREPLSSEQRRLYHISLGDAYYNLRQYSQSKSQYYRALLLADDLELKSQISYNIALTTYYDGDETTFLKEAQLILADPEITTDIRYQTSLLLADFYFERRKPLEADRILKAYLDKHTENAANVNLKRMRFFLQTGAYQSCLALGLEAAGTESLFQRRDRVITTAYCAEPERRLQTLVPFLEAEKRQPQLRYRQNELQFLLANAYVHNHQYQPALSMAMTLKDQELSPGIQKKTQLLLANAHLGLEQTAAARNALGDTHRYFQTELYTEYLRLAAEIELKDGQHNAGLRRLLRITFLPGANGAEQDDAWLRIVETYLMAGDAMMAEKHLSEFETERLKTASGTARERFLDLQRKTGGVEPPS